MSIGSCCKLAINSIGQDPADGPARVRGMRMKPMEMACDQLMPRYTHEVLANLHAWEMESASASFLDRRLGASSDEASSTKKGKRILHPSAHSTPINLFEHPSANPPPVIHRAHRAPTEAQLASLVHDGTVKAKEQFVKRTETSPSLLEKQFAGRQIERFYAEPTQKSIANQEMAIRRGFGTERHGLLTDILDKPSEEQRGKRLGDLSPFRAEAGARGKPLPPIAGFTGMGCAPGNKDPFLKKVTRRMPDYSYDPLHMEERHALPKRKPVDDVGPPPVTSQRRLEDGQQTKDAIQRIQKPFHEVPRSTRKFPQFQIALREAPTVIPGFQSMGCCDVHHGGVSREPPHETACSVRHYPALERVSFHALPGPNSNTKRLSHGEPGGAVGVLYGARARSTEPWHVSSSDYGSGVPHES